MKPPGLVARWWQFGAAGAALCAFGCFATGHPWLGLWAACGAGFALYLSAVMR